MLMRRCLSQAYLVAQGKTQAADERIEALKEKLEKKFMQDFDADYPQSTLQQVLGLIEELGEVQTLHQSVNKYSVLNLFKRAVQNFAERELSPYSEDRWGLTLVHHARLPLY